MGQNPIYNSSNIYTVDSASFLVQKQSLDSEILQRFNEQEYFPPNLSENSKNVQPMLYLLSHPENEET